MKQLFTIMALLSFCFASAQKDSIQVGNMLIVSKAKKADNEKSDAFSVKDTIPVGSRDTLQVGNIVIVTSGGKRDDKSVVDRVWERRRQERQQQVSTNWIILDLGFSNYVNNTGSYAPGSGGYLFNRTGAAPLGANDFDLNVGKSINVNIWFFMQRLNLIKQHVHLKYGLGLELNNYRYRSNISYRRENPFVTGVAPAPVVFRDSVSFSKNKLAADYLTVPIMLSFSTNAHSQRKGFSISVGVSAGYLYSQRNKQISDERGKRKYSGGIGIEQFKFSYVGEVSLGPVRLYGSYSPKSFYKNGLDMRPYTFGIRLSNW